MNQKILSLVIRARNAASDLDRCLRKITKQSLPDGWNLEIVVVDNDSTDNTVEIAHRFGGRTISISTEEFTWGKSLNLGFYSAAGEIVLLLSADAYPADDNWISEMVLPFDEPCVAAVYGRQIPRPDAPIDEIVRLKKTFGDHSIFAKSKPDGFTAKGGKLPVSNACAAIRKDIWESEHYDELISGAEDVLWTYNIFNKGYGVIYQASAQVYHSHNDPLFRNAWRSLELIRKNKELTGSNSTILDYSRYLLSLSKRRLKNLAFPGLNLSIRIKGLLLLPFELLSFCIAVPFFHDHKNISKYRVFFWGR